MNGIDHAGQGLGLFMLQAQLRLGCFVGCNICRNPNQADEVTRIVKNGGIGYKHAKFTPVAMPNLKFSAPGLPLLQPMHQR
jgi:hypothetical protein